MGGLR